MPLHLPLLSPHVLLDKVNIVETEKHTWGKKSAAKL